MSEAARVRIALIAGTLGRGGAEKQLLLAGSSLRAAGLDARVFSLTRGEAYERELERAGVPLEHIGGSSLPPLRLIALIRALRRFRPQVVESCHTYVNLYAALAARAIGAVGIGALRSTLAHTRRANGAWTRLLLAAPSALIVNSAAAAEEVRGSRTPGRGRIFVVTNAVAAEEPPSDRESTEAATVAFVGRLIPVKRLDVFLDALALARQAAPALRGLVVGDGPERARGEERAAALGLRDAVEFTGAVERVGDQLRRADFLALTSDEEGFPNVVLEAMAAGLPVLTTAAGEAARAVKDGATGYVVPPGEVEMLARRMVELATNAELRRRLGRAGYDRARDEYGVDRLREQRLEVYRGMGVALAPEAGADSRRILMVGVFPGRKPGMAMPCANLASRLEAEGWAVIRTSRRAGRIGRAAEMLTTAWRRRGSYRAAVVDVYSGRAFAWAEAVCGVLRLAHRPYVLSLHGGNLPEFARLRPSRVRRLLRGARAVVAPSRYLAEELKALRGDIRIIPNGVHLADFTFRLRERPRPRLVWIRSFHRIYDPVLAVRAADELRRDIPELTLTMVGRDRGDGSLEDTRRAIRERGLDGSVAIVGGVPHEEVGRYLDDADVFVNTTGVDNTPVSVLEAMASGLCVVSTRVGGVPYLLEDGRDAILVEPGDAKALAGAVRGVVSEPALAARLSEHARRRAEEYDWKAVLPQWRALLEELA